MYSDRQFLDTNNGQFDLPSFWHQIFYVTSLHCENLYFYLLFLKQLWFQPSTADEDDDDDVDLFGEETEEERAAAEARVAAVKASGKKKECMSVSDLSGFLPSIWLT